MNNGLMVGGAKNVYEQLAQVTKEIKSSKSSKMIEDCMTKIKAIRQYLITMGYIEKMRVQLLQMEITCIIRMSEIEEKTTEIPRKMMEYFVWKGEKVDFYLGRYPNCITAKQIYTAYQYEEKLKEAKRLGKETGQGSQKYVSTYIDPANRTKTLQGAMKTIIEEYSTESKSFSIDNMAEKLIEHVSEKGSKSREVIEEYKEGVKEICRQSIRRERIDTIGQKQAPRFVTYQDNFQGAEYLRIPFGKASLLQLHHMIEMREEQLKQDTLALNNLKEIYKELLEKAKGKNDTRTIEAILKGDK